MLASPPIKRFQLYLVFAHPYAAVFTITTATRHPDAWRNLR
jgi:hypothetical protein